MGHRRAKLGRISDLDLRLLRVFQAVAECRGLAAAELRLGINRSTISTYLSNIETRLGVRLCERGRHGFELTEDGVKVYKAATELMKSLNDFQDEIESLGDSVRGRLRVAVLDSFIWLKELRFQDALCTFTNGNPDVNLELFVFHPDEIERRIDEGKLDVGITAVHDYSSKFDYTPLLRRSSFLYCGSKHPLFSIPDAEISEADLRNTSYLSRWFDAAPVLLGHNPDVAQVETFHIEATAHLILTGNYVGFLPEHYAEHWVLEEEMRPVRQDLYRLDYQYGFSVKQGRLLSPAAMVFMDCIRAAAQPARASLESRRLV
jgi:DNA-binding transcriptional LysR family regulator